MRLMSDVDLDRARRLREARDREGMTQMELATAAGIDSVKTVYSLETGRSRGYKSTWRAIQQVLGPIPPTPRPPQ